MFVFALKFECVGFSRTWFNCMVSGCRDDSNNQPLLAYSEKHNYTDIFLLLFVGFFSSSNPLTVMKRTRAWWMMTIQMRCKVEYNIHKIRNDERITSVDPLAQLTLGSIRSTKCAVQSNVPLWTILSHVNRTLTHTQAFTYAQTHTHSCISRNTPLLLLLKDEWFGITAIKYIWAS